MALWFDYRTKQTSENIVKTYRAVIKKCINFKYSIFKTYYTYVPPFTFDSL